MARPIRPKSSIPINKDLVHPNYIRDIKNHKEIKSKTTLVCRRISPQHGDKSQIFSLKQIEKDNCLGQ